VLLMTDAQVFGVGLRTKMETSSVYKYRE